MLINSSMPDGTAREDWSESDDLVMLSLSPVWKAPASSVFINSSIPDASDDLVTLSLSSFLPASIGAGDDGGAVESDGGDDKGGVVVGEGDVGGGGGGIE